MDCIFGVVILHNSPINKRAILWQKNTTSKIKVATRPASHMCCSSNLLARAHQALYNTHVCVMRCELVVVVHFLTIIAQGCVDWGEAIYLNSSRPPLTSVHIFRWWAQPHALPGYNAAGGMPWNRICIKLYTHSPYLPAIVCVLCVYFIFFFDSFSCIFF